MERYAIYAAEQIYGGYHGMCLHEVIEASNKFEALDYALQLSYDVMDSYSEIIENLEESAID